MNPVLALRQRLAASTTTLSGPITAIDGQSVKVRTSRGVIDARSVDGTVFAVGDEVLISSGIVQGRVTPATDVPVFYV